MKRYLFIILFLLPNVLFAEHVKGFHTGPYITLDGGAVQATDDRDKSINKDLGHAVEPFGGVTFGWNINDAFAIDSSLRYATNFGSSPNGRLHLGEAALGVRWSLIIDSFVRNKFKFLPQALGGLGSRFAAYPVSGGDRSVRWGIGPYFGAGVMFLVGKYFYFGIDGRAELFFFDELKKGSAEVYEGGFIPQGVGIIHLGVHY